jgi:hypothetical protein
VAAAEEGEEDVWVMFNIPVVALFFAAALEKDYVGERANILRRRH